MEGWDLVVIPYHVQKIAKKCGKHINMSPGIMKPLVGNMKNTSGTLSICIWNDIFLWLNIKSKTEASCSHDQKWTQ